MTQRVFDVENEKDMADLWNILPDRVFKIHISEGHIYYSDGDKTQYFAVSNLIAFNWHDKTEITRPIQEATNEDIGKIYAFWDCNTEEIKYGKLETIVKQGKISYYHLEDGISYYHCRRLTKQEIEEIC
jgi:hypothetical protein